MASPPGTAGPDTSTASGSPRTSRAQSSSARTSALAPTSASAAARSPASTAAATWSDLAAVPNARCTPPAEAIDRAMATAVRSASSPRTGGSSPQAHSASRAAAGSATRYVAAQEGQVGGHQRGYAVHRAYPDGADDRRPVNRRAQQSLPRVELGAQQVGLGSAQPGQDPDQLEQQGDHQGPHHGGGALAGDRGQKQPDRDAGGDRDQMHEQTRVHHAHPH